MIRRLGPGDEAALGAAVKLFKSRDTGPGQHLEDPATVVFVCEIDSEVVGWAHGYLMHRVDGGTMSLLYEVDVAPGHRRRGHAKRLIEEFIATALTSGCSSMWVLTSPDNSPAHSLYASLGGKRLSDQALFIWRFDSEAEQPDFHE
ncbi:MAG: GNAT family N-acetyltransferase [Acidimicrobiia bacterium]|nr:GNAT family N-acetyltransferase [Acidimicrobiia bacterium]